MNDTKTTAPAPPRTLYPALRYEDAHAAIAFLIAAFGFVEHVVYKTDDGHVAHAELLFGDGMIMLGESRPGETSEYSKIVTSPQRAAAVTGSIYAYASDPDALYARATAAGALVVSAPYDTEYGSRETSFRDPEGHVWTFGTYRP